MFGVFKKIGGSKSHPKIVIINEIPVNKCNTTPGIGAVVGKYKFESVLAEAMGIVYKVKHVDSGEFYAGKVMPRKNKFSDQEMLAFRIFKHPRLQTATEFIQTKDHAVMILPYAEKGDLANRVIEHGEIPEKEVRKVFVTVLEALQYIHDKGFIHGDVKPDNLLMHKGDEVVLADFGTILEYDATKPFKPPTAGSLEFTPPEMLTAKPFHGKHAPGVDVWMFGVTVYILLYASFPFLQDPYSSIQTKIKKGEFIIPEGKSPAAESLLRRMLDVNLETRITMSELAKHEFCQPLKEEKENNTDKAASFELCQAAYSGDLKRIKHLIGKGASANAADYDGRTPLHLAAAEGHAKIASFLIESKADINAGDRWGQTALDEAVKANCTGVVDLLRNAGGKMGDTSAIKKICQAALNGDLDGIKTLLKDGATCNVVDLDGRSPLHLACGKGHLEIVKVLVANKADIVAKDRWGNQPLFDAQKSGQKEIETFLKSKGARSVTKDLLAARLIEASIAGDVGALNSLFSEHGKELDVNARDYDGRTALHVAASQGQDKIIEVLIEHSADIDPVDAWGGTPLMDAIRSKKESTCALLMKHGAKENMMDDAVPETKEKKKSSKKSEPAIVGKESVWNNLCEECKKGNLAEVQVLIGKNADVLGVDFNGRTALHIAAAAGHKDVVQLLLDKGAKVEAIDRWGNTPMTEAMRYNQDSVTAVLKQVVSKNDSLDLQLLLCQAAAQGNIEKLQKLLDKGAEVNTGDYDNRTALHLAASEGHLETVKYLLDKCNAGINVRDRWGGTALQDAIRHRRRDVVEYLRSKGAWESRQPNSTSSTACMLHKKFGCTICR